MKKNLMTVIILALVLVNLVLTAILAFTIIPQTRKSNQLIDKIASAIDLELEDGVSCGSYKCAMGSTFFKKVEPMTSIKEGRRSYF